MYNNALAKNGFKHKITFQKQQKTSKVINKTKNRKIKIMLFKPPFRLNVLTNVGKKFFSLLGKHFPKTHPLHKFFNRNYISLPNFKSVIKSKNILNDRQNKGQNICSLNGSCQFPDIKQNHLH